ncbi:MAG: hypothetical protein K2K80_07085, partial [Clostridia bacterium]|nr:hypothetical protein [Clostridia bacterium]
ILVDDEGCTSLSKEICKRIDYELIANSVADKLREVFVENDGEETDYEEMAARISEKITVAGINEDAIAEKAAAVLSNYLPDFDTDDIADKVAEQVISAMPALDGEALSETITEKLIESQQNNDYEIVLDEDGLDKVSDSVSVKVLDTTAERFENIDKDIAEIKELLDGKAVDETEDREPATVLEGYEELRSDIAEIKEILNGGELQVQSVSEEQPISDEKYEELLKEISEIKELLDGEQEDTSDEKYEEILKEIEEIKEMLSGAELHVQTVSEEEPVPEEQLIPDEKYQELLKDIEQIKALFDGEGEEKFSDERLDAIRQELTEIKELLASGIMLSSASVWGEAAFTEDPYIVEETLVTVSDVIGVIDEEEESEEEEQPVEEPVDEAVKELVEEITEEAVEEPVEEPEEEESEEEPEEDEAEDDDGEDEEELAGGVDFANMMRYNRSFIARIIQSTDDQKLYYGEVRNALLSYRKVNSNIAWGAERFHKGRETIARFKIRGKTLVLYLALDPATHEFSVYHHKDVSDNKSVAGTPMMIKIKSPRGVKKAIRLIDEMLEARDGVKRNVPERDYAAMYPYESMEELIEDGLVKDVKRTKFNMNWK